MNIRNRKIFNRLEQENISEFREVKKKTANIGKIIGKNRDIYIYRRTGNLKYMNIKIKKDRNGIFLAKLKLT